MDVKKIEKATRMILEAIGENPEREGLRDTPARVARMYQEIFCGIGSGPEEVLKRLFHESYDEMIVVKDIPLYSMCEHHMLPFLGQAHVAYIPEGKRVLGLSKIARLVDIYARRLQVQERLTQQIARAIRKHLQPKGVLVVIEAEHMCMTMRGVQKPGTRVVTSAVRGLFRKRAETREEAMGLIRGKR